MKKPLLALAFFAASFAATAQTSAPATPATAAVAADAYTNMMVATIKELQSTNDPAATQQAISKFERAATVASNDWLPRYYQAYGYVRLGFVAKGKDQQDKYFDQAQTALDQARALPAADASEIGVMQAYLYQGRIMVSPMTRAMQYTAMVGESLGEAEKANPQNPRVHLVRGNDFNFRPKMFGGGPEAAKPHYQKAKTCFDTFKPASSIAPDWGKGQLTSLLKQYDTAAVTTK
ncbi:hypothetical protein MTX78_16025 [Hymenobacter tibetensis]|uniref:Tetratricopeptide repeat protein n=1 Tax=Hymenobacter tibetensis TaxID=497967 RepID=A0ABY4D0Z4_9BACT|nr:hypothetical protein [Hymenobacter tibetensis]UOG73628.1 hypothetical protein MTX78_16025 [Hymenobacter tibetensis]